MTASEAIFIIVLVSLAAVAFSAMLVGTKRVGFKVPDPPPVVSSGLLIRVRELSDQQPRIEERLERLEAQRQRTEDTLLRMNTLLAEIQVQVQRLTRRT